MIVGYLPNAADMKVLIVSWNVDNEKEHNPINIKTLLPFIQSKVNEKKRGLFSAVDLYFFSFQEVGTVLAAGNTEDSWDFLAALKKIDATKFTTDWKQVSMYGTDKQGTVGFIVYNSASIGYDDQGENAPVVNKAFKSPFETGVTGRRAGNKAFLLSGQFKKVQKDAAGHVGQTTDPTNPI